MSNLRQAAQQALEAIESDTVKFSAWTEKMLAAATALRAALAEPRPIQECYGDCPTDPATCPNPCRFEGRPKPEKNPFGDDAERYARKLREEREVRNLADYEFKTYKTGGVELEAGFYSTDELRDLVKALDKMNAATERSMRRMK